MNPREVATVLGTMRTKLYLILPQRDRAETSLSLGHAMMRRDWFRVSPALFEAVNDLYEKVGNLPDEIRDFKFACHKHGIEVKR